MTMSLRTRLLVGVIALVIIGLAASGVATYLTLENSLLSRLDAQLTGGRVEATAALNGSQRGGPSPTRFPTDTVVERIRGDDVVDAKVSTPFGSTPSSARPLLPHSYPSHATDTPVKPFTVAGTGDIEHFRMTYWPEDSLDGDIVVLAIPMTDVDVTLGQLLFLELAIGSGIVIATAILAFAIINVGLRPLQRMGSVAGEIAAGDYSRRVEPATPLTEIGRLGLALNAMLAEIESAFAHRTASEQRLRRFIADASHELRTPLTSIRGYSEMLRRGAGESPEDASLARRRIEEESVRMSALVDDMLLIARLDQGRPIESKPVDLQAIARDAAADARVVAPQREISLQAPDTVMVSGDDTRLRQVVGNLVRNALVHTPSATPIEIAVATTNGTARVSVADHGPGLKPEDRERIFEPFFRADPSRSRDSGGAGLGLSIVSAVVVAHGGRVEVRETNGGGATFEVALPLAKTV